MNFTQKWRNSSRDTKATYGSWVNMRRRCLNSDHPHYHRYGGRGISICQEWLNDYDVFYEDMGERPQGYTLERQDNEGNYNKENCFWASRKIQADNRSTKVLVTIDGITKPVTEWMSLVGACPTTYYKRIKRGLTPKQALTKAGSRNKTPQHGTNSMYSFYGCRCDLCKRAGIEYRRRLTLRRQPLQFDL